MKGPFWEKVKKTTDKGLGIISKNWVKRKAFVGLGAAHFVHSVNKPRAGREGGSRARGQGAGGRWAGAILGLRRGQSACSRLQKQETAEMS